MAGATNKMIRTDLMHAWIFFMCFCTQSDGMRGAKRQPVRSIFVNLVVQSLQLHEVLPPSLPVCGFDFSSERVYGVSDL